LGVFKWVEFTDEARNKDFLKSLNLDPITDTDVVVKEKDLKDDECEIEMRTNMVVTLLMSMSYCYLKLHYHTEALKCLDYAIELAPVAADAYLRRSQVRMYNKLASISELKLALEDINIAIEKRPKDKLYKQHKELVNETIRNQIAKEVVLVSKLVQKA
jgi:tetratricopeptide (TPR) repeat protein